jgi:putative intracellular protease/amidase
MTMRFLQFIQEQARGAKYEFSVCTGALLCVAASLIRVFALRRAERLSID